VKNGCRRKKDTTLVRSKNIVMIIEPMKEKKDDDPYIHNILTKRHLSCLMNLRRALKMGRKRKEEVQRGQEIITTMQKPTTPAVKPSSICKTKHKRR